MWRWAPAGSCGTRSDNTETHKTRTQGWHGHKTGDASLVQALAKGVNTERGLKACLRNAAVLREDVVLRSEQDPAT